MHDIKNKIKNNGDKTSQVGTFNKIYLHNIELYWSLLNVKHVFNPQVRYGYLF